MSMLFDIDFTKAEELNNFEALPNGEYECVINSVEDKTGEEKPHIVVELTVRKDVPQEQEGFGGSKIWDRFYFNTDSAKDFSIKRISQLIKAVGGQQGQFNFEMLKNNILAQPVRVKTKQSTYNDNIYTNVKEYKPSITAGGSADFAGDFTGIADEDLPFL